MDEFLLVLAGGLIGLVTTFFNNRSAETRLDTTLKDQAQQRAEEHKKTVYNERIESLKAFASAVEGTLYFLVHSDAAPEGFKDEAFNICYASGVNASSAMIAIGEHEADAEVDNLVMLYIELSKLNDEDAVVAMSQRVRKSLALIDGHRLRLSLKEWV